MKDKTVAAILAFFLGGFGIHQFYLGNNSKAILYLIFFWTIIPAIIAFIDGILLLTMSTAEFDQRYNAGYIPTNPINHQHQQSNMADQLDKLYSLKMRGAITDEEYQIQKRKIMA